VTAFSLVGRAFSLQPPFQAADGEAVVCQAVRQAIVFVACPVAQTTIATMNQIRKPGERTARARAARSSLKTEE
jgi:hypothetical protein